MGLTRQTAARLWKQMPGQLRQDASLREFLRGLERRYLKEEGEQGASGARRGWGPAIPGHGENPQEWRGSARAACKLLNQDVRELKYEYRYAKPTTATTQNPSGDADPRLA